MRYKISDIITHVVYIGRWVVLALPGTAVLKLVQQLLPKRSLTLAMLISQGLLGSVVFFVDRRIFGKKAPP